jgi:acetyl esterase
MARNLHPDMARLVRMEQDWPPNLTLAEERITWREFCLANNQPCPRAIEVENLAIGETGHRVPVRIYRPKPDRPAPCFVYIHGGGWILGDLDTNDSIAWGFAEGTGATVVSVDYRLAPEHPFPAAFDDCYGVVTHLARHASAFGIDSARIAVGGDSAGGNLTAAVALALRDRGGPPIVAQVLIYPVLGVDLDTPSYRENADAPLLTLAGMEHYLDAYLGGHRQAPSPYAMPLMADDLTNLPPAFVHTAEHDPLRDEGKIYADRLVAAGNVAEYRCARGMVHSFMRARFEGPGARAEFDAICAFLRRHLGT